MKRREFHRISALAAAGYFFMGLKNVETYSVAELIGKEKPARTGIGGLRMVVSEAFQKMQAKASEDGIDLLAASAYRSYDRQEQIWTSKYRRFTNQGMRPLAAIERIIEYSTIPGTSRHHWGTDVDVIDGKPPRPAQPLAERHFHGGVYSALKEWLDQYAESFGFYLVYTQNPERKGFKYEPWHLSYRPVSYEMLKAYRKIDVKSLLQDMQLVGSQYFTDAFIDRYRSENILDINPDLL
jgi:hypothetical protein